MNVQALINDPVVESALVPLLVGWLAGRWLRDVAGWGGLAVVLGFLATTALVMGLYWSPLTSTRKIVLLGLGAALVAIVVELFILDARRHWHKWILPALAGLGMLWIAWPALQRLPVMQAVGLGGLAVAYSMLMTRLFALMNTWRLAYAAGFIAVLGAASSVLLFSGASALLGQLAMAVAAGAAGLACAVWRDTRQWAGHIIAFSSAVLLGYLGGSGLVFASLPAFNLLAMGVTAAGGVLLIAYGINKRQGF